MALSDDTVLYHKYDSDATDSTANGLDGTVNGATNTTGHINNCYDFDGSNDYISVADDDLLSFGNGTTDSAFSVTAWIYMDSYDRFTIANKGNGTADEWMFITQSDGTLSLFLMDGSFTNRINAGEQAASIVMTTGNWYFVACSYNGNGANTGIKIYIDGTEITTLNRGSSGSYTAMENTTTALQIGRRLSASTRYSNGKIDELAIFDKELSQAEVTELYNSGTGIQYPFGAAGFQKTINGVSTYSSINGVAVANISSRNGVDA